jgi:filamentous hemagglutinin family protein
MHTDHIGTANRVVTFVTLNCFLSTNMVWAQQIVIDGNTDTQLTVQGNVTDVTTATIRGSGAYNSFQQFDVYAGNVVNLRLPDGTTALLNLVNGPTSNVDGVLNAIRDGRIGGNVYFANPNGLVVGADGVINVGSLTVITPTKEFMDGFFTSPGTPSEAAAASLMDGSAPISGTGLIAIEGTVNAIGDVYLIGTNVTNAGQVGSGAVFAGSAIDFTDVVNVSDLATGMSIAVRQRHRDPRG